ncbi:MAG TPA: M13 family metallopeptidase [Myxococcales bacterium]|nr:M13 family metallopeptidase [Myxococcales bacterium]
MKKLALLPLLALFACAHEEVRPTSQASEAALTPPPPNVDLSIIDKSVAPCDDFYAYACNGWMAKTQIPPDRPLWNRSFSEIDERNLQLLRGYLEADAAGKGDPQDPYEQKLGDFWTSCMDEALVEKSGPAELKALLARVDEVTDPASLARVLALLQGDGISAIFEFGSGQDFKDATQVIGQLDQGGLGLPDRDYYLKDDKKSVEIRALYLAHVAKMLELAGESGDQAKADADTIMKLETELAKASQTRVERRQPENVYHRIELAGVEKVAPDFPWQAWLSGLDHPAIRAINVASPDFFKEVNEIVAKTPPADLRAYLRWHVIDSVARALPKAFVDEDFEFRAKAFTGAAQILPRWKRCIATINQTFGQALARPFIRQTFGEAGKARNVARIQAIEATMGNDLAHLPWMDAETRQKAIEKLGLVANQIGYPDKWRDYGKLAIDRASYLGNLLRAEAFEVQRDLNKIGKPVDRSDWDMNPQEVNAYYDPSLNEMVFPAGILQPPFFNRDSAKAANYGGIGMVMGHELTHGFDDEGRQFDGHGNLKDWWTATSAKAFDERAQCVVHQFDGYVPVDDLHINGKLTLGENIADLGGITLSYKAFEQHKAGVPEEGGYTPEQQFFLNFAQSWCQKTRDPYARLMITVNPHSPARFRVLGPLGNFEPFREAFSCKEGDKMVRPAKDRCEIW